jgi:hypothetical protein
MAEFHKAEFYRGSVFECLSNRLSIEGRPVRLVDDRRTKLAKAKLATGETFTAASLPELAKVIIDGAAESHPGPAPWPRSPAPCPSRSRPEPASAVHRRFACVHARAGRSRYGLAVCIAPGSAYVEGMKPLPDVYAVQCLGDRWLAVSASEWDLRTLERREIDVALMPPRPGPEKPAQRSMVSRHRFARDQLPQAATHLKTGPRRG